MSLNLYINGDNSVDWPVQAREMFPGSGPIMGLDNGKNLHTVHSVGSVYPAVFSAIS